MKWFWILLAISPNLFAQTKAKSCSIDYTLVPPFYLANVEQGRGFTEKVKVEIGRPAVTVAGQDSFVAKSTYEDESKLVLQEDILISDKSFEDRTKEFWAILQSKVDKTSSEHVFQVLFHNKSVSARKNLANKLNYAQEGEHVTVQSRHINLTFPVKQKFILKESKSLNRLSSVGQNTFRLNQEKVTSGAGIQFVRGKTGTNKNGFFKIIKCSDGLVQYLVQRVNEDGINYGGEFAIDSTQCGGLDANMQAINEDSFSDIMKLAEVTKNLNFHHGPLYWSAANIAVNPYGYTSLPLNFHDGFSHNTGPRNQYGGYDYVHVRRQYWQGAEKPGSDTWGKPASVCSFMDLAKSWKNHCMKLSGKDLLPSNTGKPKRRYNQCTLQVNEMAFYNPFKRKGSTTIDPLGHSEHSDGDCFDIRPLRKDEHLTSSTSNHSDNSSALNGELIKYLRSFGATNILYNDPRLGMYSKDHKDHIHFCLSDKINKNTSNSRLKQNSSQCWSK